MRLIIIKVHCPIGHPPGPKLHGATVCGTHSHVWSLKDGESCGFYFSKFNPGAFVAQVVGRGPLRRAKLGDLSIMAHPWNFQDADVGRGTVSLRVVSHSRLY